MERMSIDLQRISRFDSLPVQTSACFDHARILPFIDSRNFFSLHSAAPVKIRQVLRISLHIADGRSCVRLDNHIQEAAKLQFIRLQAHVIVKEAADCFLIQNRRRTFRCIHAISRHFRIFFFHKKFCNVLLLRICHMTDRILPPQRPRQISGCKGSQNADQADAKQNSGSKFIAPHILPCIFQKKSPHVTPHPSRACIR